MVYSIDMERNETTEAAECNVTFTLAGAARRLILDGSPEPEVREAVKNATRRRHGRGYQADVTCPVSTANLMADYLWGLAGVVGDMTAAERDGGTEQRAATEAVRRIESALRTHRCSDNEGVER